MKKLLIFLMLLLVFTGCISKQEQSRRTELIKTIEAQAVAESLDISKSIEVRKHNTTFCRDWLIALEKRGYKK